MKPPVQLVELSSLIACCSCGVITSACVAEDRARFIAMGVQARGRYS